MKPTVTTSSFVPLLCAALLALQACAFDASGLGAKQGCRDDADCIGGLTCIDQVCEPTSADGGADLGSDSVDGLGPDASDASADCGAPNGCGGCALLGGQPGTPCNGGCGTWRCDGPDQLACETLPRNACGGCGTLEGTPATPCGDCGLWACEPGGGGVLCDDEGTNACGGCGTLDGEPAGACGSCGDGEFTCEGTELVCLGGEPNACGSCGGPADVVLGEVCACDREAAVVWRCDEGDLVCADTNGHAATATMLGETTDARGATLRATDAFQSTGDIDWFRARAVDVNDLFDGLFPQAVAIGLPSDRELCAYWIYDDRRSYPLQCAGGSQVARIDGILGCCASAGSERVVRILRDRPGFERMDDDILDPGASSGTLFVVAFSEDHDAPAECSAYEVRVTF